MPKVLFEKRGHVAYVTINRPEAHNALDPETNKLMAEVFAEFAADDALWIGVLTGSGDKAFSAGADLKTLIPRQSSEARNNQADNWNFGGITRGFQCYKPLIASINGFAIAGGMEMVLACDLRIASVRARFGLAEVRWAIIPGAGGTQRLPRSVPLASAMEIILTGEQIDANEAYRIGLINKVVPHEELAAETEKLVTRLLKNGPLALRAAKEAVLSGLEVGLSAGIERELALFNQVMQTADAIEGPRAFAEKREPHYQGR